MLQQAARISTKGYRLLYQKQGALIETLFCQSHISTQFAEQWFDVKLQKWGNYMLCVSFTSCGFEWMCLHVCILGKIAALLHKHWCLFWDHNAGTLCEWCDVQYKVRTSNSALPCMSTRGHCIKSFYWWACSRLWIVIWGAWFIMKILYWLPPEPFTAFFIVPCKKIIAEILKYLQQSNNWKNI